MKKMMILVAAAAMSLAPISASAARIFVGGGFGPYWGPGYGYGYYGPAYGYSYAPQTGEVKIDTHVKDAEVWINGAFAGTVKDAHSMHLRPGSYAIEVRHGGMEALSQQVYVVAGKTMHLHPDLPN